METVKKILDNIRTIRKQRGFTQENIAKVIGVERSTYVRKEAGAIPLTLTEFVKIIQFLGIDYNIISGNMEFHPTIPKEIAQLNQMMNGLSDTERKYVIGNTKNLIKHTMRSR